ncbi:tyrosine-protein phosphatase [Actinomadura parmotrematis]|uniref:Tyrosine-protein phosphatase n=1 Tax=Actinomadura parmotrematis TaxID=2864039 RepID=A0ABS7FQV0_9ACTN|nr:tyrosine-protein phosphatase [Actinomadura parmotrematis]MBW8482766.1 tyrosine-protein phosphatase [Actinomadura parmotrematis]
MSESTRWIPLDGAVNVRDLGGLPTHDGRTTRLGRVLRADNLQDLSVADTRLLLHHYALKNVIDLRSDAEVSLEGPGPLTRTPSVTIHHLSLFSEGGHHTDVAADTPRTIDIDRVLPWQNRTDDPTEDPTGNTAGNATDTDRSVGHYHGYLRDRGDSIVAALRIMTRTDGSALVHCAAGKDRTGVVCALALETIGVTRQAIVTDYTQTGERIDAIMRRLRASDTYAADLDSRPDDSHVPHAAIMEKFLSRLAEEHGGAVGWLAGHGWTDEDTAALQARLLS